MNKKFIFLMFFLIFLTPSFSIWVSDLDTGIEDSSCEYSAKENIMIHNSSSDPISTRSSSKLFSEESMKDITFDNKEVYRLTGSCDLNGKNKCYKIENSTILSGYTNVSEYRYVGDNCVNLGGVSSCSSFNSEGSCNELNSYGCSWQQSASGPGICEGTVYCNNLKVDANIFSTSDCEAADACEQVWLDSYSGNPIGCRSKRDDGVKYWCGKATTSNYCNGDANYPGCDWMGCRGTFSCESIGEEGICESFGCSWYPNTNLVEQTLSNLKDGYAKVKRCYWMNDDGTFFLEKKTVDKSVFGLDNDVFFYLKLLDSDSGSSYFVDVKSGTSGEDNLVNNLKNTDYFTINDTSFRIFFDESEIKIFNVSSINRLTYNIFPVCGNGVCENFKGQYPPESCLSCSFDCPAVDEFMFNKYSQKYDSDITFDDIYKDVNTACKVKTGDSASTCNPLCITHKFLDKNGCLFKLYSNSLPAYNKTKDKNGNGSIIDSYLVNMDNDSIFFNDENYDISYYVKEGENEKEEKFFMGDYAYENGKEFFSNSECNDDCECLSGNCDKDNNNEKGHCCPIGFNWSNTKINKYCKDGVIKDEFRTIFSDVKKVSGKYYMLSTLGIDDNGNYKVYSDSLIATDYICLDKEVAGGNFNEELYNADSCKEGYDPICVYDDGQNFIPAEDEGIWQCRKDKGVEEETLNVDLSIKCTISSNEIVRYVAPGDNIWDFEKETYVCDSSFLDDYLSKDRIVGYTGPAHIFGTHSFIRVIDYEDFCTTEEFVCASKNTMLNEINNGSFIKRVDCVPGTIFEKDISFGVIGHVGEWKNPDFVRGVEIRVLTIGQYCSIFGNDLNEIIAAGGNHLSSEEWDQEEKFYFHLWNYDSCKENFGDKVPPCHRKTFKVNSYSHESYEKDTLLNFLDYGVYDIKEIDLPWEDMMGDHGFTWIAKYYYDIKQQNLTTQTISKIGTVNAGYYYHNKVSEI